MSYSDFKTPEEAIDRFKLSLESSILFGEAIPAPNIKLIEPSHRLSEALKIDLLQAININTEKARSELIVTPILREVCAYFKYQIGYFSGRTFTVSPNEGLNGECDFILSANSNPIVIQAPVLTVVEAKNSDIGSGLGQCIAQMVAIDRFNQQHGATHPILGAVTTGTNWRFMTLDNMTHLAIDQMEYLIPPQIEWVLGILIHPFTSYLGKT